MTTSLFLTIYLLFAITVFLSAVVTSICVDEYVTVGDILSFIVMGLAPVLNVIIMVAIFDIWISNVLNWERLSKKVVIDRRKSQESK